ncbi:MAG TPA: DUF1697 domain-containing protein [Candidatus Sulfotelmatobacter sp.]
MMPVVIAMLRAVNVGGRNRIKMDVLRDLCMGLDLRDAKTYVQSGNLIFRAKERSLVGLAATIQTAIEKKFKCSPEVILRTTAEMRDVVARNPFAGMKDMDPRKLLVDFLASEPDAEALRSVQSIKTDPEKLYAQGREIYMYFPNGAGRSKLSWPAIEKRLKTPGTARNWNSVTKLLEMAESYE